MSEISDIKKRIQFLGFQEKSSYWAKKYSGYFIQIDFKKESIDYGDKIKVEDSTTSNFSQAENFVVLECVDRLLRKGYKPEHLTLEKKWQLGRSKKSGKADIVVQGKQDKDEKTILIIECKTSQKENNEFDKETERMQNNGGQLFSSLQQDRNAKYLCLYTSQWEAEVGLVYKNRIIKIEDKQEDLNKTVLQIEEEKIKLYKDAKSVDELFAVWKETFNCYFHYNGIFEKDVNAYEIDLKPLKRKDLKPFSEASGTFNTFMEILRHNNISDNANAFNRILSLFLCKLVDEEKSEEEILDFQVKEGEDEAENIQDRLQKLYKEGMDEFLGEEIIYHSDDEIEKIIKFYPKQTPIEEIKTIFKEIKYYTHNEFAFKEVHNQKLFHQNAKVLREVIKLLQNYRFKYNTREQILGDFFELLLNHGVKQSEGQFFTPIPIVKFMILSLGMERFIHENIEKGELHFIPKVLDFACGSGHFLTEAIEEIQKIIQMIDLQNISNQNLKEKVGEYQKSTQWAKHFIFGIEKDYRLARTSKIACFMSGDGDGNIIFGDGLEDHAKLGLGKDKDKFDYIIANPPYSVKAFKNHLSSIGKYTLGKHLTEKSSEIETLFIERTAGILKEAGRAAIILPSSILSNAGIYTKARELLLEKFKIVGITKLGNKTFGATGTNTIILFLQRRSDFFAKDRKYIAKDLFSREERKRELDFIDSKELLRLYAKYRGFSLEDYLTLIHEEPNEKIRCSDFYKGYQEHFKKSKEILKEIILKKIILKEILKREEEKFYFFLLTLGEELAGYYVSYKVVLSHTGDKSDEQKAFLGYEFSQRKGSEGIKIDRDAKGNSITGLFDEEDHQNLGKLNSYIVRNFQKETIKETIEKTEESIKNNVEVISLADLLDFERVDFEKEINTVVQNKEINKEIKEKSKYDLVRLGEVFELKSGGTPSRKNQSYWKDGNIKWLKIQDYKDLDKIFDTQEKITKEGLENSTAKLLPINTVVVSIFATVGRVGILKSEMATNQAIVGLIPKKDNLIKEYYLMITIKYFVDELFKQSKGTSQQNINSTILSNFKIPLPPLEVQGWIVLECEEIDAEVKRAKESADGLRREVAEEIKKVVVREKTWVRLGEVLEVLESGNRPKGGAVGSGIFSLGGEHILLDGHISLENMRYVPLDFFEQAKRGILQERDILICKDGALTGKVALIKEELRNKKAMINEHVFLLRTKRELMLQEFLFNYLFSRDGQKSLKQNITGTAQGGLNSTNLKQIKIPLPPLEVQKSLVSKIEAKEKEITKLQQILTQANNKKEAVLTKYLEL